MAASATHRSPVTRYQVTHFAGIQFRLCVLYPCWQIDSVIVLWINILPIPINKCAHIIRAHNSSQTHFGYPISGILQHGWVWGVKGVEKAIEWLWIILLNVRSLVAIANCLSTALVFLATRRHLLNQTASTPGEQRIVFGSELCARACLFYFVCEYFADRQQLSKKCRNQCHCLWLMHVRWLEWIVQVFVLELVIANLSKTLHSMHSRRIAHTMPGTTTTQ